jgi:7,8-dihydropterin-6-yl-methyl-4-(beta-D-ribofuranosyl)aminobenzene 5'-phosphate synthase
MWRCRGRRTNLPERDAGGPLLFATLVALLTAGSGATANYQEKVSDLRRGEEGSIIITVVYDNSPSEKQLIADWGFACVVKGLSKTILFDTGAHGDLLLKNLGTLGIAPTEINVVVLSHVHWDHTGGLTDFLQRNNNVIVFLPAAFPKSFKDGVRRAGAVVVETEKAQQICPGASTTPVLGEKIVEQGLCLETGRGIVVVTGCAHPGIVEMTRAAQGTSGNRVYAVLGGFHMYTASAGEVTRVIETLRNMGVQRAGPCHCSGDRTRAMMKEALARGYIELGVGTRSLVPGLDKGEGGE